MWRHTRFVFMRSNKILRVPPISRDPNRWAPESTEEFYVIFLLENSAKSEITEENTIILQKVLIATSAKSHGTLQTWISDSLFGAAPLSAPEPCRCCCSSSIKELIKIPQALFARLFATSRVPPRRNLSLIKNWITQYGHSKTRIEAKPKQ